MDSKEILNQYIVGSMKAQSAINELTKLGISLERNYYGIRRRNK